jgi:hypothetical protein
MADTVTLITTAPLSPYNENEVFTVSEKEADMLLNPTVVDERGRTVKVESRVKVFDPKNKAHKDALVAQRGKVGDEVVPAAPVTVTNTQHDQDVRNDLADAARPIAADRAPDGGEQDQARVEAEVAAGRTKPANK